LTPIALSIAGSDPSGGAGVQADLKTFYAHGVFGMAVISLLTAQNTRGVQRSVMVEPGLVRAQLAAVLDDAVPHAIKTGALGGREQVEAVADLLCEGPAASVPLVVDPVCVSKTGAVLLDAAGRSSLVARLLPRAALFTPNLDEAALLLGSSVETEAEIRAAGRAFRDMGAAAVLMKGGHRAGEPVDLLCTQAGDVALNATRIVTQHTHGVGCTLSAAIAARLAQGRDMAAACRLAKAWLTRAIASAPGIGAGQGAVDHFAPLADLPDNLAESE
jgi:hydroxymethylpyrimidine/phosphomethylpyrimidine kinase